MSTLRYWAAARAAAGRAEEQVQPGPLDQVLGAAARDRPELARVLALCSFLVDGDPVGGRAHSSVQVGPAALVDALPPFAGG